jgi:hypothetical protein
MEAAPTTAATPPPLCLLKRSKPGSGFAEREAVTAGGCLRKRYPEQAKRYGDQCSKDSLAHTRILS